MKSGFVAICGRPNAGKSTLMNKMIGEKVAIVSNKPQTTRTKIMGVRTTKDSQIVFIDTPGIHKPHNKLGQKMEKYIYTATQDVDILLYVVDCNLYDNEYEKEKAALEGLKKSDIPVILVVNKVDTVEKINVLPVIEKLSGLYDFAGIVPLSAKMGDNVDALIEEIEKFLDEGPQFFPGDLITDQPERQIAAETIREKILRTMSDEIPHGTAVMIEEFTEDEQMIRIRAEIYCEKQSHKGILVGKNGENLKKIGTYAREDLEAFFGMKVYLNLWVKVKEKWRDDHLSLNNFGFKPEDFQ